MYAIPYEGEEGKLYWANHDPYSIKTSEYFRDYSFKLPSGKRAHFKLVEADTEKDNRKEIEDSKRRFVLAEQPLAWRDGEVVIRFEFRPEKANQSKCNEKTMKAIFGLRKRLDEQIQKDALTELTHPAPTEGNPGLTLLEKHLEDYTCRNKQDYFIHKDLGKFLRRELDFYIKNEIMHLDNVENESAPRVEEYLSKIKVIRQIAHKIIYFLARIEYFLKNCGSRRSSWRKPITASPWIGSPRNYILRLLPTMPNEKNGCPICGSHPEITKLEDYTEFCGVPFPGDHGMEENSADLTATELQDRLTQGEIFGLVDVHQLEETKISRISGAEFIPYDILAGELDRFTPDEKNCFDLSNGQSISFGAALVSKRWL